MVWCCGAAALTHDLSRRPAGQGLVQFADMVYNAKRKVAIKVRDRVKLGAEPRVRHGPGLTQASARTAACA